MIKVIASDMDGTLLDLNHKLNQRAEEAIRKACKAGLRFMIVTGRNFDGVMQAIKDAQIVCDYIVSSGAEVRNPQKDILFSGCMKPEDYKNAYEVLRAYEICCVISTDNHDYYIGTREELQKNLMQHIFAFNQNLSLETIKETELYQRMVTKTIAVPVFQTLMELKPKVVKVLAFSNNLELLAVVKKKLGKNPNLAVASSSPNNLEITDVVAQKGPVLKNYIESLGYSMEEVMVFGDSLNDYSMLSMEFGATIAMENAVPEVKAICKYVTKSNVEDGVAHAIEELLKKQVVGK